MRKFKLQPPIKKTALALASILTLGVVMMIPSKNAAAIDLRYNSIVEGSKITLGDIFSGLDGVEHSHKAERVLGAAPRPGSDMVLNARTLMRIAIALDLPWRPGSTADQVVLRRAATIVDQEMIQEVLAEALQDEGLEGDYRVLIPGSNNEIILSHDLQANVVVKRIRFDAKNNRFDADLVAPSLDNPQQIMPVSGTVERLRDIPVLRSTLRNGDVIGVRDIDFITMPVNRLKHNVILDANDLIGTTPRRLITPDQPIISNQIEQPLIIRRGELVTMVYREGNLVLTGQGKAMQDGAKGDPIRVVNMNSSRSIEAVVSAEREVEVKSF